MLRSMLSLFWYDISFNPVTDYEVEIMILILHRRNLVVRDQIDCLRGR